MARTASRSAPAVRSAVAERREGLDHARGDRCAVRGPLRQPGDERADVAGVLVAESVQQDSRDHRSGRTRWRAAAALRFGLRSLRVTRLTRRLACVWHFALMNACVDTVSGCADLALRCHRST